MGVITIEEMKEACQKFALQMTDYEVTAIMRHFDTRQDGQISYNEFCDVLLEQDYPATAKYSKVNDDRKLHQTADADYTARTQAKTLQRSEVEKIRRAARGITDAFSKKAVTVEMVHAALLRLGLAFDLDDIERTVLFLMPGVDPAAIPYFEFLQAVNCSFHDLAATR